jgi:starch phosphorylase
MSGTRFTLEVQPVIPERLQGLSEIANDLLYSWDRDVRRLFIRLDPPLWNACGHNPKVFLRRISQKRLDAAAEDRTYLEDYHRTLSAYNSYHREKMKAGLVEHLDPRHDLVAYFCAEFGLHESMPIYSGGLGILAGDHCKAASDLGIPFVAVGLMYRQGYFTQTIDASGHQVAHYHPIDFADLPIKPAKDPRNQEIHVHVDLPGRRVHLKLWSAKAGHITIYLLDSDLAQNNPHDRAITYQLYGGDIHTRIQQEIVLGIGGVRALRALELKPSVWHINEGHAAFMIVERCRELVAAGMDFDSAMEQTASGTVYTTHTPVPAGHDIFHHDLMGSYFGEFVPHLGIDMHRFRQLGHSPTNPDGFNMTALALRGSRFHNGVSRIHGGVASKMEGYVWPQVPDEENPIRYVTNGVHVPTFLARGWTNLFDMQFGREWRNEMLSESYWEKIDNIPDYGYWSLHQSLKSRLLEIIRTRATLQHQRNGCSAAQVDRLVRHLAPNETDVLILGFARRFATYKRATLLFSDPARLAKLLNDPKRPVLLVFAGKAHPNDQPGKHLIKTIHEYSRRPEFEGRIILLEGYDISLARHLVIGVDVWVNTPTYPLEASGTSGQKAGINGVLNLSVLDGWWGEGYNGSNGWGIVPHEAHFDEGYRNQEESKDLLNILENEVIPTYFNRNGYGYSEKWVKMSKSSMKSLIPRFNAQRMVRDYIMNFYGPAARQLRRMVENNSAPAHDLAKWKQKIAAAWPKVSMRRVDSAASHVKSGASLHIQLAAHLDEIQPGDVRVECLVGKTSVSGEFVVQHRYFLEHAGRNEQGETLFQLDLQPELTGLVHYQIRMYPYHELLSHPFETGWMIWL